MAKHKASLLSAVQRDIIRELINSNFIASTFIIVWSLELGVFLKTG
jgi:hypothetical protein